MKIATAITISILTALGSAQQASCRNQSVAPSNAHVDCAPGILPLQIQQHLNNDFGSWKIQEPTNLSSSARERWQYEKPIECPGLVIGQFEHINTQSYALLLVPASLPDAGYRFVVFSPKRDGSYNVTIIERSDEKGASDFFIHTTLLSKFFDVASMKKFGLQASRAILFADAGEDGYGTDVYFWKDGRYQHEPVDY